MTKRYYSNGKLLLTSEYVVLDGIQALALPTKAGQDLCVDPIGDSMIHWTSYDFDGSVWLEHKIDLELIKGSDCVENTLAKGQDDPMYLTLVSVLRVAHQMNPMLLSSEKGFRVQTHLDFPRVWGLGTSSTWINNLAQWFDIDAFELLWKSFGGSGYDVACAQHDTPILYRYNSNGPLVVEVGFDPDFKQDLYFVYLNQKQNSKQAIQTYRGKKHALNLGVSYLEALTTKILGSKDLVEFQSLIQEHESCISAILDQETVQERLFSDFSGAVKSLGAWGGDFVIVACQSDPTAYFKAKGFTTIIPYTDMIL